MGGNGGRRKGRAASCPKVPLRCVLGILFWLCRIESRARCPGNRGNCNNGYNNNSSGLVQVNIPPPQYNGASYSGPFSLANVTNTVIARHAMLSPFSPDTFNASAFFSFLQDIKKRTWKSYMYCITSVLWWPEWTRSFSIKLNGENRKITRRVLDFASPSLCGLWALK